MAILRATRGLAPGTVYGLQPPSRVVGRNPKDCDVVLEHFAVSRKHALLELVADVWCIQDLDSRNGVFVNGKVIRPGQAGRRALYSGDRIEIAAFEFIYDTDSDSDVVIHSVLELDAHTSAGDELIAHSTDSSASMVMTAIDAWEATPAAKLEALMDITRSVGTMRSLGSLLPRILDSLFRILPEADCGVIMLVDNSGKITPECVKHRREPDDELLRINQKIVRTVMKTREAVLSDAERMDAGFEMSQSLANTEIRPMMCAPLLDREGSSFGIIQIESKGQRHRFHADDLELLVTVAFQASIGIENVKRHDRDAPDTRIGQEFQSARVVQQSFLPWEAPALEGYEFFSHYMPAAEVGGDYYDYIQLPDGRLAVIVADVLGRGVAAAMFFTKLVAETRHCLQSESDLENAVNKLNTVIADHDLNWSPTFALVALDPQSNVATVLTAGFTSLIWRGADGHVDEPKQTEVGPPLGLGNDVKYKSFNLGLKPGDSFTLCTDGLYEAKDATGAAYTWERVVQGVSDSDGSAKGIGKTLVDGLNAHLAAKGQDDDVCVVCVRRISDEPLMPRGKAIEGMIHEGEFTDTKENRFSANDCPGEEPRIDSRMGVASLFGTTRQAAPLESQLKAFQTIANLLRTFSSTDMMVAELLDASLGVLEQVDRTFVVLGSPGSVPEIRWSNVRWSDGALELECRRLAEMLQRNHVHLPSAIITGFQNELLRRSGAAHEMLRLGFAEIVLLDGYQGRTEDGEFEINKFKKYAIQQLSDLFDLGLDADEYHPELLSQILKDEDPSLLCLLNMQVIPDQDLRRLRGFSQGHHQMLCCGPHDFGATGPSGMKVDRADDQRQQTILGVAQVVIDAAEIILSSDVPADRRYAEWGVDRMNLKAAMCVPLRDQSDAVVGALYADSSDSRSQFSTEDLNFLQTVGVQLSLGLSMAGIKA